MNDSGQGGNPRAALADEFEHHRPYLRSVAYRILGSMTEAEDALQESWLRLERGRPDESLDLRPWLTTVVARICLDVLRRRRTRPEEYGDSWLPEPLVGSAAPPEDDLVLADSVGLALLVVLEALSPAERLAFVLHDVFALPFEEIAAVIDRSPVAARQLASRARRRVRASQPEPDADVAVERRVVDAFLLAARAGDFGALLSLLDPEVTLRIDAPGRRGIPRTPVSGAAPVAEVLIQRAPMFARLCRPAVVNGGPGFIVGSPGHIVGVVGLTVVHGLVREVDIVADPRKLRQAAIADAREIRAEGDPGAG